MKFFFRITDINTVADRFDYIGPKPTPVAEKPVIFKESKTVRFQLPNEKKSHTKSKTVMVATAKTAELPEITEEMKNRIQKEPLSEKSSVYTNITLNRSNNVEIITKIQKVSNKNGQPIGLNIIKQTVKKSKPVAVVKKEKDANASIEVKKEEPILPAAVPMEIDVEKSNFLKSIELTAKNTIQPAVSPQKVIALNTPKTSTLKRKNASPLKTGTVKKAKVLKLKTIQNPAVRQIVSNVNQSATNVTKIVERNKDLQTLFDNCKINIPSSLSITLKENSDGDGERRTPVQVKPVQNYIEILRLPDTANANKDDNSGSDVVCDEVKRKSPQTFQKMFEEAIKKPNFAGKKETVAATGTAALDLSGGDSVKRNNIAEITQQLYKKQEKNNKVAIPRLKPKTPPDQSIDCHSASLGMNYKVSVEQKSPNKVVTSSTVSPSTTNQTVIPKPTSSLSVTTTTTTTNTVTSSQSLSPNQLLEKYNIQNLAQLTASFNLSPAGQLAALQQAMILKHFEMQNRQNWLNMNPSPLVQYEKYLQSLQGQKQQQLLGKEN